MSGKETMARMDGDNTCDTIRTEQSEGSLERVFGRCVEVGDDDDGQPRLIIHTTHEQLKRFGRNLAYVDVAVTIAPPNEKGQR